MTKERVPTLTKKDVARRVAELQGEPIYKSEPWVNAVIEAMRELMVEADPEVRIELRDFGVFEVKKTKAKPKARNPKTNETVFIPSQRTHDSAGRLSLLGRSRAVVSKTGLLGAARSFSIAWIPLVLVLLQWITARAGSALL